MDELIIYLLSTDIRCYQEFITVNKIRPAASRRTPGDWTLWFTLFQLFPRTSLFCK